MTSTSGRPVALVTGSTGGMGRCIVADLAATHDVVALGRNTDVLAELAQLDGVLAHAVDITDATALAGVVGALRRLDVLLHVAAISVPHTVADATPQQWREHFETNVFAPAELTRLGLPLLRQSLGTVIFIGSGASTRPAPGNAVYTASKHALQGMADTLRIDEATTGVRVSTIAPGPPTAGCCGPCRRRRKTATRPNTTSGPPPSRRPCATWSTPRRMRSSPTSRCDPG